MERVVSGKEILERISKEYPIEPVGLTSNAEVAKRYRYADGSAEFGNYFGHTAICGGCTRARISADGKLYTCLFASSGFDLKEIMRAEGYEKENLYPVLSKLWGRAR